MSDPRDRDFWDSVADGWHRQVGRDGDENRRLNSDPVLWDFLGDVRAMDVLDAGCGTGYLAAKLVDEGAEVLGVDFSDKMIEIASANVPEAHFRVDSCETLASVSDRSVDRVVSNYVLMDLPDIEAAVRAFHRVLRPGGWAVVVFSHPCFPGERASEDARGLHYAWPAPYFERRREMGPPWGHFTQSFPWYHRPLSDYWKAFRSAGFEVTDFEEPRITPARYHLAPSERKLKKAKERPYSVAFRLLKPE
ncbi:MAG: class I SAM-dependent methyltransferase [Gemmatimonadota bacterium]